MFLEIIEIQLQSLDLHLDKELRNSCRGNVSVCVSFFVWQYFYPRGAAVGQGASRRNPCPTADDYMS